MHQFPLKVQSNVTLEFGQKSGLRKLEILSEFGKITIKRVNITNLQFMLLIGNLMFLIYDLFEYI